MRHSSHVQIWPLAGYALAESMPWRRGIIWLAHHVECVFPLKLNQALDSSSHSLPISM